MAFHPYPGVVPAVFNRRGFGPPQGLTPASACPGVDRPASRPRCATCRPVQARFRCGSVSLNLAARRDSLAHSTKGTPSQRKAAPTAWRRTVSGAVSLPSRGAFHLSLTVLVRYRSQESVQPWRVVPPASRGVPRAPRYSGPVPGPGWLRVRGSHPLRPAFPRRSAAFPVSHPAAGSPPPWTALQPPRRRKAPRVWAGPVPLAATPGISVDFSSSGY